MIVLITKMCELDRITDRFNMCARPNKAVEFHTLVSSYFNWIHRPVLIPEAT